MSAKIRLLSPKAPACRAQSAKPLERLDTLGGKVVGFVDNSKPNFNLLVEDIADLLKSRYGVRSIVHRKHLASLPAADSIVDDLALKCDLVVTGSGD